MGVLARWSHRHTNDLAVTELLCAKLVRLDGPYLMAAGTSVPCIWHSVREAL